MKKLLMILLSIMLVGSLVIGCAPDEEPEEDAEVSAGEQFGYEITGIDAGAGIMGATEEALETYPSLAEYTLIESSDAAMTAALDDAYGDEEWIVVTGWTPHWKFGDYDLKFLEDPEGVYGDAETINALVREGLADDAPEAADFFDNYFLTEEQAGDLMLDIQETGDEEGSSQAWMEENADLVAEWIPEDVDGDGQEISIGYMEWECAIAMSNLAKAVLEDRGFDVNLVMADPGPIYSDIASGDTDAMVASWQPVTHGSYMEEYDDELDDLGPIYEGARIGLVVPEHVDIDSIEDME